MDKKLELVKQILHVDCHFKPLDCLDGLLDSVDRAFAKQQRWWQAMQEWKDRRIEVAV